MTKYRLKNGRLEKLIICRYRVVNGKVQIPKKGYYAFWVPVEPKQAA